jgi:hypothetical protein
VAGVTGRARILVPLGCLAFTALGVLIIVGGEPVLGGAIVLWGPPEEALQTLRLCLTDRRARARLGHT